MRLDEHGNLNGTSTCLWEAITQMSGEERSGTEKAWTALQHRLGESACMSWQEIGITPTAEGWVIHINACNEDGKVEILIPKDRKLPVQILKDTRATSESYPYP